MTREEAFKSLFEHAHYASLCKRLSKSDIEQIETFISENVDLPKPDFFQKQRELYLGKTKLSKNWALIDEILCVVNYMIE